MNYNKEQISALIKGIISGQYKSSKDVPFIVRKQIKNAVESKFNFTPHENNGNKLLLCIGGGQCSGKTTIKNFITNKPNTIENPIYITSKIFKDNIPEYNLLKNLNPNDAENYGVSKNDIEEIRLKAYPFIEAETFELREALIEQAIANNRNIIIESQMHDFDNFKKICTDCKEQNYTTLLIHPHISMDTYFERVERREQETGRRAIHSEFILKHQAFARNIPSFLSLFDTFVIINNNPDINKGESPYVALVSKQEKCYPIDNDVYKQALEKQYFPEEYIKRKDSTITNTTETNISNRTWRR